MMRINTVSCLLRVWSFKGWLCIWTSVHKSFKEWPLIRLTEHLCVSKEWWREWDGSKSLRSRSPSRENSKENHCKLILIGIQTGIIGFQASVRIALRNQVFCGCSLWQISSCKPLHMKRQRQKGLSKSNYVWHSGQESYSTAAIIFRYRLQNIYFFCSFAITHYTL